MTLHRDEHGMGPVPEDRQDRYRDLLDYDGDLFPKEEMLDAAA